MSGLLPHAMAFVKSAKSSAETQFIRNVKFRALMMFYRSSMNGGLLIKQEHTMVPDQHLMMRDPSEPMHHIIKRELHSEYEELDQEPHLDGMAEDLTTSAQNHGDSNMLDA